jgi:hypothetical protein
MEPAVSNSPARTSVCHAGATAGRTRAITALSLLARLRDVSGGAAREQLDIGREALRRELDPLGHGQVRRPGIGQLLHRHADLHRVDTGQDHVAGVLGQGMNPE